MLRLTTGDIRLKFLLAIAAAGFAIAAGYASLGSKANRPAEALLYTSTLAPTIITGDNVATLTLTGLSANTTYNLRPKDGAVVNSSDITGWSISASGDGKNSSNPAGFHQDMGAPPYYFQFATDANGRYGDDSDADGKAVIYVQTVNPPSTVLATNIKLFDNGSPQSALITSNNIRISHH